jgi:hypothetical protein
VKKNNKLIFYTDSYGRDIPMSFCKSKVDISVYDEVRSAPKVRMY